MPLRATPLARYYQISEMIRRQIVDGDLVPDDRLPTEDMLGRTYAVSRGTVRKALDLLEQDGLIRREQGRGMFVQQLPPSLHSFALGDAAFTPAPGRGGGAFSTRTLAQETLPASVEVAARLRLRPGAPVIHIAQVHLTVLQPALCEERYLSLDLCPGLATDDLSDQSVHWLLVHRYHVPLIRVEHTIEYRPLDEADADRLNAHPGEPAYYVDRLTFRAPDIPAVWYRAVGRGDHYQFRAEFRAAL